MAHASIFNFNIYCLNLFKNQTRPIVNLSKAAKKFGKGESIENLRPSGALESGRQHMNLTG